LVHSNQLELECCSLFWEPFHLVETVFGFVGFHAFVDMLTAHSSNAIDESGQRVGPWG